MAPTLNRNPFGTPLHDLLELLRDRLLDLFFLEFNERTRRMKTLRRDGVLLRWNLHGMFEMISHVRILFFYNRRFGGIL
jgi:hypothetical protein